MTEVDLDPGICGMRSIIQCHSEDGRNVELTVDTNCKALSAAVEQVSTIDAYEAVFSSQGVSPVHTAVQSHCTHAACPAASAILKGIEVECGLALAKDFGATIRKIQKNNEKIQYKDDDLP
jgi:hypothetical protein